MKSKFRGSSIEKVYIAAPFSSRTNSIEGRAYGIFQDQSFVALLERIETALLREGLKVCLIHRDEGKWGEQYIAPERIACICHDAISKSDLVIALPQKSRGVHMELGWASELGKALILFIKEGEDTSIFIPGFPNVARCVVRKYTGPDDLLSQVLDAVREVANLPETKARNPVSELDPVYAVIDIGSSTLKFSIATVNDSSIRYLRREATSEVTLSDDINAYGHFTSATLAKVISVLRRWKKDAMSLGHPEFAILGTGALRKASDSQSFVAVVKDATGLETKILSEDEEAKLIYFGTVHDFPKAGRVFAVLNVGGGSTELILGTSSEIWERYSLQELGIRRLNSFLKTDPPLKEEYDKVLNHIEEALDEIPWNQTNSQAEPLLVHTGGELSYVVSAGYSLLEEPISPTHTKVVSIKDFERRSERIRQLKRRDLYRLAPDPENPKWMDGAIASNALAITIARRLGVSKIVPSDRNIIDGVVLRLKEKVC